MSDQPTRCEPPESLRGVDGWHWVGELLDDGGWHPSPVLWRDGLWITPWFRPLNRLQSSTDMADMGYRYIAPIPAPAAVSALVKAAREAEALLAWSDALNGHGNKPGFSERDNLTAALAAFQEIGDE